MEPTEGIRTIGLRSPFARGLIADKGVHLTPESFCSYCMNIRTVNGTTTIRKWYTKISDWPTGVKDKIQWLVSADSKLYSVIKGKFYEVDVKNGTMTEKAGANFSQTGQVNFVVFWKKIICCDWAGFPQVFDTKAGTFTDLTTDNIESWANPRFGTRFVSGTYLAGGGENKNVLYISKWVEKEHLEYAYDFVNNGSERMYMNSDITGIQASRGKLYIFTKESIEIITRESLSNVGGVTATYSMPIAGENRVASNRSVVIADDRVFFFSRGNNVRTLEFIPWVTDVSVWDLSNRQNQSIQGFLNSLDEDQSLSFWYYNKESKLVYFHLKSKGEVLNDVILVYDVVNDNFFTDNNKYFSDVKKHEGRYYAGSETNSSVFQDDTGNTDDWTPIHWIRVSPEYSFWDPNFRKEFRQLNLFGELSDRTIINQKILIDWQIKHDINISNNQNTKWGTASQPIASRPFAMEYGKSELIPFEYWVSAGNLRARGKKLQIIHEWKSDSDFCLSGMSVGMIWLWDRELKDKSNNAKIKI